jgi:hypothetical protein
MRPSATAHVLGLLLAAGCSAATTNAMPDGSPPPDEATVPETDAGPDAFDATVDSDASAPPADSSFPMDGSNPSTDGALAADAAPAVPPFVDPFDGASGCPDGGYPLGRGPCAAVFPLSGYPALDGVFQPGACDNNNDGYASVWFASDYGYGQDTNNVRVDFSTPLKGMVGPQPVTVSIDIPDGDFNRLTWSTPPGACTVTLATDVCWDFEDIQYYLVDGTGHCTSPASSSGDAGGSLTIGDFWFQTLSYP